MQIASIALDEATKCLTFGLVRPVAKQCLWHESKTKELRCLDALRVENWKVEADLKAPSAICEKM